MASSLRNQLRPKHQVLILKCYPKFQKNVPDVKPNSSELSYLLYYASTRRSKIQKVGAFLEKKTESDVRRGKTGNVQVTLAILAALIDRTRRDLTLYAPYVLRTLKTVLASGKLGLVEDSVSTFQAFCEHQDVATFAADQTLIRLYEDVVKTYASFAKIDKPSKVPLSKPISVRWRTAGLTAIGSITKSDAIGVDGGLHLATIIPVILENLHSESEEVLNSLYSKVEKEESSEKDPYKGRPSMATQGTNENAQMTDGTTEDADRIAEEEVGVLALQSLKRVFSTNNRGQIRMATQALLRHILVAVKPADKERPGTAVTSNTTASMLVGNWPTAITQMVARWTPVQDRFVIMVTTMEELVKSPIAEENLEQQLVLVLLIDSLLSSSINMIGLSVMDVLLGLIQHILLLLQLGGTGSSILPHHQQTDAIDLFGESSKRNSKDLTEPVAAVVESAKDETNASTVRQRLLDRLRICMGALANHIYYSDQIADMIAALLLRLKPSPMSSVSSPVAAVENPEAAAQAISDSVKMQEDPKTDTFFSFGTARVTALNAIQNILVVANSKASVTGAGAVGRNRVPVQTWEGTQWLLRDEDKRVRRAYVDALTTWLRLEMSKNDLSVMEDRETRKGKADAKTPKEQPARALSNASRRSKSSKAPRSTFLQLLHLAVYDNAIEAPEDESETLLLHLLLFHLVQKLGVNSVQHGLPMIVRLQEDINQPDVIATPKAKIVTGSLVHGYFWALLEHFSFDNTLVGHEIISEIQRRKKHQLWLQAIQMPPVPLGRIMVAGSANAINVDPQAAQAEVLRPFDGLSDLVNQIATAYSNSLKSPPSSPPTSPGKSLNTPILATTANTSRSLELPDPIREAMLSRWTKAGCLASIENSMNRATSLHGSQRGTLRSVKNGYLYADSGAAPRDSSPGSDGQLPSPTGRRSMRRGLAAGKAPIFRASMPPPETRARSPRGSESQIAGDTRSGIVRFEDLKRMLDNDASSSLRNNSIDGVASMPSRKHAGRGSASISVGSESMVDAEGLSDSEDDEATSPSQPQQQQKVLVVKTRTMSQSKASGNGSVPSTPRPDSGSNRNRTRSSSTASAEDPEANARALKGEIVPTVVHGDEDDPDAVPPVPPLPEGLIGKVNKPRPATNDFAIGPGAAATVRPKNGSIGESSPEAKRRSNAQKILSGIDIGGGSGVASSGNGGPRESEAGLKDGRPPY